MNRILEKKFQSKFISHWIILFIDLFIVFISSLISYYVILKVYQNLSVSHPNIITFILIVIGANLSLFLVFRTYQGIIRYSTIYEAQKIFITLLFSHTIIFFSIYIGLNFSGSVTSAYCTALMLSTSIGLLGFRSFAVLAYQKVLLHLSKKQVTSVFIFDTSPDSVSLSQSITIAQGNYKVVGFITLNKINTSKRISNLPIIFIKNNNLGEMKKYGISTIVFASNFNIKENNETIQKLISLQIKILLAPKPADITDISAPQHKQIRPVEIEDLLGRKEIDINMDEIAADILGRNVLVTGAAGSIGSEIVRQLALLEPKMIICLDKAETPLNDLELELLQKYPKLTFVSIIGNIRNQELMDMVFDKYKPNIVYHAAAYKHVPMMEKNPCEAILTNVFGTKIIVEESIRTGVEMFVMISTDKAVNPTNVMGASKRIAEIYVQSCALRDNLPYPIKLVTTRFGNVLGSNGSVIPLFRKQIEKGGPLTVTDPEITRYFMTIPEACKLVLQASTIGHTGYIYVFDMGEPVKIIDLATKMIELAGLVLGRDIHIEYSGLRPGEKLYEELLNDQEQTMPTSHKKVMIAKVREYEYAKVVKQIDLLIHFSINVNTLQTVSLMKDIVPEFISNNSIYERLDEQVPLAY